MTQVLMPVSFVFAVPFIQCNDAVRLIWNGKDITPPCDHAANRRACVRANEANAKTAARLGIDAPYYHYDAISGRALQVKP